MRKTFRNKELSLWNIFLRIYSNVAQVGTKQLSEYRNAIQVYGDCTLNVCHFDCTTVAA